MSKLLGALPRWRRASGISGSAFYEQYAFNVEAGPLYQPPSDCAALLPRTTRILAYYLPQFHTIPENDHAWGRGFTEWTNVTKALPRFSGHYQPRLPGELGFYDLKQADVLRQQCQMARHYGIEGFCFHYYIFGGKQVLGSPLEMLLARPEIEIGFCINWANEPWTKRWNGSDGEVILVQDYLPESLNVFADSAADLFKDPRYIRVDGRPLLMIYKPGTIPEIGSVMDRLRIRFRDRHGEHPLFVMPHAFGNDDPRPFGMDAAAGFPPHNVGFDRAKTLDVSRLDPTFGGTVLSYQTMVENALADMPADYPFFPGVCPSWDNEARRSNRGTVFQGSTPDLFGAWLTEACRLAARNAKPDERIVFVNAWNEWAEGAHLEPDRHFGYAYLRQVPEALKRSSVG